MTKSSWLFVLSLAVAVLSVSLFIFPRRFSIISQLILYYVCILSLPQNGVPTTDDLHEAVRVGKAEVESMLALEQRLDDEGLMVVSGHLRSKREESAVDAVRLLSASTHLTAK